VHHPRSFARCITRSQSTHTHLATSCPAMPRNAHHSETSDLRLVHVHVRVRLRGCILHMRAICQVLSASSLAVISDLPATVFQLHRER
jgi:hypothetical protein